MSTETLGEGLTAGQVAEMRAESNVREATIFAVLGYSGLIDRQYPVSPHALLHALRGIFGFFEGISFQVLRFGKDVFEITITRVDKLNEKPDVVETVTGMIGDTLRLPGGELVTIEAFFQADFQLKLKFWSDTGRHFPS